MKYLLGVLLMLIMACNSNTKDDGYTEENLPNPEKVNPPADAIPEDMKIKNDSVVVVDSAALRKEMDSVKQ